MKEVHNSPTCNGALPSSLKNASQWLVVLTRITSLMLTFAGKLRIQLTGSRLASTSTSDLSDFPPLTILTVAWPDNGGRRMSMASFTASTCTSYCVELFPGVQLLFFLGGMVVILWFGKGFICIYLDSTSICISYKWESFVQMRQLIRRGHSEDGIWCWVHSFFIMGTCFIRISRLKFVCWKFVNTIQLYVLN